MKDYKVLEINTVIEFGYNYPKCSYHVCLDFNLFLEGCFDACIIWNPVEFMSANIYLLNRINK